MTTDPFLTCDDATPADFPTRPRGPWKAPETVGLGDGVKAKPRKVDFSPLQRRWFEANGYTYARVEHANAWGAMTVDLWGCWDWLAVRADCSGVLLVQTTSREGLRARRRKIRAAPETEILLAAGNTLQIHAWHQPGGPGTRWEVLVEDVGLPSGPGGVAVPAVPARAGGEG